MFFAPGEERIGPRLVIGLPKHAVTGDNGPPSAGTMKEGDVCQRERRERVTISAGYVDSENMTNSAFSPPVPDST
ncbi:hypothetical protein ACFYZ3_09860 [Streptomyces sp. NPDC001599]|uniref:hypothetical protein n=1 Tax=Streptomyces sp. NPDC001599 TaxID=3364591 RepID=UPI0036CA680D